MLKSADVMELEIYSDEEIAGWDKEDSLEAVERDAILKNLSGALARSFLLFRQSQNFWMAS